MKHFNISIYVISFLLLASCTKHHPVEIIDVIPVQTDLEKSIIIKQTPEYNISALAEYEIKARVLGIEKYYIDKGSDFSPYDFAVGWKKMSDPQVLSKIKISQGGRFYFWYTKDNELLSQSSQIISQSANMHIVPANNQVKKDLARVEIDHNVYLKGYLIKIQKTAGWNWTSSLSRTDTGNGACELIWVTDVIAY